MIFPARALPYSTPIDIPIESFDNPLVGDNGNTSNKGQDNEISDNNIRNRFHGFWLCEHHGNSRAGKR